MNNITLTTSIPIDNHVRYVEKTFDMKVDDTMTTEIPLSHRLNEEFDNIGVIWLRQVIYSQAIRTREALRVRQRQDADL